MAFPPATTRFNEIFDFLASGPTTGEILAYQPPADLQARISDLLERNRAGGLTAEEREELEEFLRLDRFISRLKLHARKNTGGA